jgi:hypothetical protein
LAVRQTTTEGIMNTTPEHGRDRLREALTEAELVALFTAAKAEWLPPMGRDPLELAVERILADRLAPLLAEVRDAREALALRAGAHDRTRQSLRRMALRVETLTTERDEARAERAKAWDGGWDTGQLWAFSDLDEHDRSTNPYRAALGGQS